MISKGWGTDFLNSCFKKQEFLTALCDGSNGRASMYVTNPAEVLQIQMSVLEKSEDFILKPLVKEPRTDVTAFQSSPVKTKTSWNVHKIVQQLYFGVRTAMFIGRTLNLQLHFFGRSLGIYNFSDKKATRLTRSVLFA